MATPFTPSRTAWEGDRRKETALGTAGYRLTRVTWRLLTEDPLALAVDLARALGA